MKFSYIFHILLSLFNVLYPFVFPQKYDIYYIILNVYLFLQFKLYGECILSVFEKRKIDPNYKVNQCSYLHPHIMHYIKDQKVSKTLQNLISAFVMAGMARIILRSALPKKVQWTTIVLAIYLNLPYITRSHDICAGECKSICDAMGGY